VQRSFAGTLDLLLLLVSVTRHVRRRCRPAMPCRRIGRATCLPFTTRPPLRRTSSSLGQGEDGVLAHWPWSTQPTGPMGANAWAHTMRKTAARVGLDGVRFHDLRHHAAVAAYRRGAVGGGGGPLPRARQPVHDAARLRTLRPTTTIGFARRWRRRGLLCLTRTRRRTSEQV
jgi:hypothetical protein